MYISERLLSVFFTTMLCAALAACSSEPSESDIEEASALLGASRLRTVFQVVLPHVYPALLTGFALAFARGVGEYGSVIFIVGNIPLVSEIAPLLIVIKLEDIERVSKTFNEFVEKHPDETVSIIRNWMYQEAN